MKHRFFHRVGGCFGFTLWSWRKRVELWVCFEAVEPHSHPGQHVEIVPLFGWADFVRVKPAVHGIGAYFGNDSPECPQLVRVESRKWFHAFSIPSGWRHWFTLKRAPLVFLNITTGESAADNFVTT